MEKIYERINWEDAPSKNTPINSTNLNKMDLAIDEIDNRLVDVAEKVENMGDGESGSDGYSPIATVVETDYGAEISITDVNGTTAATIYNGKDGENGEKGEQGERGPQGVSGVYVGSGEMPDGYNIQIDPNGKADELVTREEFDKLSKEIGDYLPKNQGSANVGKILVVGTDGNLVLTEMPDGGESGDVTGVIDEANNILLTGNLANGTYTLKYENADGTYTDIGTLTVGEIVRYVNLFSQDGEGFANNTDFSGASSGRFLTNYIPCKVGDIIHMKGATAYKMKFHNGVTNTWGDALYANGLSQTTASYDSTVETYTIPSTTGVSNIDLVQIEIRSGNTALDNVIITVNQDIVD